MRRRDNDRILTFISLPVIATLLVIGAVRSRAPANIDPLRIDRSQPPRIPKPDSGEVPEQLKQVDPFRISNRPSAVRHGQAPLPERPPAAAYRPRLQLKAIVGGPPWTAIIGGVPGQRGDVILAVGEQADSLRVRAIDRQSVSLVGPDTVWTLRLPKGP
jgi:hypothetical protein